MQNSVKILEIFPSMLGSQTESTDIKQIASRALDKPGVFKLTWRLSTNLPNWGSPSLLVDLDSWTLTTTKKTSTVRSRLRCWFQLSTDFFAVIVLIFFRATITCYSRNLYYYDHGNAIKNILPDLNFILPQPTICALETSTITSIIWETKILIVHVLFAVVTSTFIKYIIVDF